METIIILILINLPWFLYGGLVLTENLDRTFLLYCTTGIGKLFAALIVLSVIIFITELKCNSDT